MALSSEFSLTNLKTEDSSVAGTRSVCPSEENFVLQKVKEKKKKNWIL